MAISLGIYPIFRQTHIPWDLRFARSSFVMFAVVAVLDECHNDTDLVNFQNMPFPIVVKSGPVLVIYE